MRIYEENNQLHVEVPAPGLNPKDIDIRLMDGTLQIKAESTEEENDKKRKFYRKSSRSYYNVIALPTNIDSKSIPQANYHNGVLDISLQMPKIAERKENDGTRITVNAGARKEDNGNRIETRKTKSKKTKNAR